MRTNELFEEWWKEEVKNIEGEMTIEIRLLIEKAFIVGYYAGKADEVESGYRAFLKRGFEDENTSDRM